MPQRNAIQDRQSQRKGFGGFQQAPGKAAPMSHHDPDGEAEQVELKGASPVELRSGSKQAKKDLMRQVLHFLWAGAEAPQRCEQVVELRVERLDQGVRGRTFLS